MANSLTGSICSAQALMPENGIQAWVIALIVTGALTIAALVAVIIMLLRGQRCPAARSETEGER